MVRFFRVDEKALMNTVSCVCASTERRALALLWGAAVCLFVLSAGSSPAHALPSDANQPVRLLADRATYSERTGVTTYSGNVSITQGTLKIHASDIVVNLSNDRSISSAVANGRPATFEQVITQEKGLAKGQANKVDYNAVTGIVTLTGNAKLSQAGASFAGNTIRYSLKDGDVEANAGGGQRVELIIPPNTNRSHRSIR